MADRLVRNWWALASRGAAAALFGMLTLTLPGITVDTFVALFAIYAMADGVLALITAMRWRSRGRDAITPRDLLFDEAVAGTVLGIVALGWPAVTMQVLLAIIALWGAATGWLRLSFAHRAWRRLPGAWLYAASGVAGLALGGALVAALAVDVVRVGWVIASAALSAAVLYTLMALRVRAHAHAASPELARAEPLAAVPDPVQSAG